MKRTFRDYKKAEKQLKAELSEFVAELSDSETLAQYLLRLMREKGLESPQVYRNAELDRQIFNKLIQHNRLAGASKQTLMQVCIGIMATEEEAKKILSLRGYIFELSKNTDKAFMFCIRKGEYDMTMVEYVKYILDMEAENGKSK